MRLLRYIVPICRFARSYLVAIILVSAMAFVFVKSLAAGFGPVPQHPPDGIAVVRDSEQLEWSSGKQGGPLKLQVSVNDPGFGGKLLVDESVKSKRHVLRNLRPGAVYFWRLVQNGKPSHVSKFYVTKDAVRY